MNTKPIKQLNQKKTRGKKRQGTLIELSVGVRYWPFKPVNNGRVGK